jgi:superfamily II DNA or RNA helicase
MKFRYDAKNEELVISESTRIEYNQLKIWLTRKVKGYRYMQPFKMGIWSGDQSYFRNGKINLGLWRECFKGCKEIEVPFIIENKEDFPINRDVTLESVKDFCDSFFSEHKIKDKDGNWIPFKPYDHQIESAYKILKNRFCMAEVATSGGKSLIISIVIFYTLKKIDADAKFLLIVPSINLVTQFYENIFEYNFGFNFLDKMDLKDLTETVRDKKIESIIEGSDYNPCFLKIEEIMSDRPRKYSDKEEPNIYIGTYQSLEKYPKEFFKQFHTVACDEAHGAKSKTILSILKKTFGHAYSRFGVSGTFPPDDSCEILTVQSVLGPKITEVTANQLKEKGIITPMEIKAIIMNHNDSDYEERLLYIRKSGLGKEALELEKDFIHNSDKRTDVIKKLIDKCDKNTLLLFHSIEYGQKILNKLQTEITDKEFYYIDGEVKNKKREEIKKILEESSDKVRVLVASYGTLSTGISIKNLHFLILADSFKSETIIIQSIGRLLRLFDGKTKAVIFDLVDIFSMKKSNTLYKHFLERVKMYEKRKYPYIEKIIKI